MYWIRYVCCNVHAFVNFVCYTGFPVGRVHHCIMCTSVCLDTHFADIMS